MTTIVTNKREIQVTKTYYDEKIVCDICGEQYQHAENSSYDSDVVDIKVDHGTHYPEGGHWEPDDGDYHLCGPCWRSHVVPILNLPKERPTKERYW